MQAAPLDLAVLAAYLLGMLAVGWFVSRRVHGFEDWFVAGRRMTTPVLTCALVSTYYGLDVTFGTSETAYLEGLAAFFAYSAPFYVFYLVTALLVAPRLRRLPALSLPEAMGHFYGRPARVAAACASFLYSAPILSVTGMGLIGHHVLGWDPWVASAVGAGLALVYTVMGGLWADALTDTVQFVLMCVTVAAVAVFALLRVGGPEAVGERLGSEVLAPLGTLSMTEVLVFAGVALTPLVEPAFYQRTFAARETGQIVRALLLGVVLWMAYDWLAAYLGLVGRDRVAAGALPEGLDESAIMLHVTDLFLPAGLYGLFLAGCLAAAMSTFDSYTLIAAGNLVYDVWQPLRREPLSDRALLLATRAGTVVTAALALALAMRFERLRDAWIFMSTILLSTVLVPMLAALAAPRPPRARAGQWAAVAGGLAALTLFLLFELGGTLDATEGTRVLHVAGTALEREAALLLTVPLSALAFVAGHLAGRPAAEARP